MIYLNVSFEEVDKLFYLQNVPKHVVIYHGKEDL